MPDKDSRPGKGGDEAQFVISEALIERDLGNFLQNPEAATRAEVQRMGIDNPFLLSDTLRDSLEFVPPQSGSFYPFWYLAGAAYIHHSFAAAAAEEGKPPIQVNQRTVNEYRQARERHERFYEMTGNRIQALKDRLSKVPDVIEDIFRDYPVLAQGASKFAQVARSQPEQPAIAHSAFARGLTHTYELMTKQMDNEKKGVEGSTADIVEIQDREIVVASEESVNGALAEVLLNKDEFLKTAADRQNRENRRLMRGISLSSANYHSPDQYTLFALFVTDAIWREALRSGKPVPRVSKKLGLAMSTDLATFFEETTVGVAKGENLDDILKEKRSKLLQTLDKDQPCLGEMVARLAEPMCDYNSEQVNAALDGAGVVYEVLRNQMQANYWNQKLDS